MKIWVWAILTFLLVVEAYVLLVITDLVWFLIILPLLLFGLLMVYILYNYRESLQLKDVPENGYESRLLDLDRVAANVELLGFRKIDQFCSKTFPNVVTYAFKHEKEPFIFFAHHEGVKPFIFINTRFEDDYGLNTANFVSAGGAPSPPKWLLQIFPNDTPEGLLSKHREAYRYITDNGLRVDEKEKEEIRHRFLEGINKQRAYIKKMFLWPAALLIRTITRSGEKYCRTIKEQYPDGILRI